MKNKVYPFLVSILPLIMTLPLYVVGDQDIKFLAGEFVYCLLIVDVILGLRPTWIEKYINLKLLYSIHGMMAMVACLCAFLHVELSHLHGIAGTIGNIAYYGIIGTIGLALIFLSRQFLDRIPYVNNIVEKIRELSSCIGLKREVYDLLHVLSPLIVILIVLHVVLIDKFSHNHLFMCVFLSYFVIFGISYLYEGIYKKINVTQYQLIDIKDENPNVYQLSMHYYKGKKLKLKGGQYLFISTDFAKWNEYHPFSILEIRGDMITLGIKKSGDFTEKLSKAKQGEIIKVRGVYGHMTPPDTTQPIVAIAGGIGITPCISLLQSLPKEARGVLIWSLHDETQLAFRDKIDHLEQTHPHIRVLYHFTATSGHLNQNLLQQYLSEDKDALYYLCGPGKMMEQLTCILQSLDIPNEQIESEGFIF